MVDKTLFIVSRYARAGGVALVNWILFDKIETSDYSELLTVFLIWSYTIYLSFGLREYYLKKAPNDDDGFFFSELLIILSVVSTTVFPAVYIVANKYFLLISIIAYLNIIRSIFNAKLRRDKRLKSISANNLIFVIALLGEIMFVHDLHEFLVAYLFASLISAIHFVYSLKLAFVIRYISIARTIQVLRQSFPLLTLNICLTTLMSVDKFFVLQMQDSDRSIYHFASSFSDGIALGLESVLMIYAPMLLSNKNFGDSIFSSLNYQKLLLWLIVLASILYSIGLVFLEVGGVFLAVPKSFPFLFTIVSIERVLILIITALVYSEISKDFKEYKTFYQLLILIGVLSLAAWCVRVATGEFLFLFAIVAVLLFEVNRRVSVIK